MPHDSSVSTQQPSALTSADSPPSPMPDTPAKIFSAGTQFSHRTSKEQTSLSFRTVVGYHADCDDGFGAAFVAWLAMGARGRYLGLRYGADNLARLGDVKDEDVFIIDFSLTNQEVEALVKRGAKSVTILDHHLSAMKIWQGYGYDAISSDHMYTFISNGITVCFDMQHSGAMLAWQYFFPEDPPSDLIEYVQDNDLWRHYLPGSRQVTRYIRAHPFSFEVWDDLNKKHVDEMIAGGELLEKYHFTQIDMMKRLSPPYEIILEQATEPGRSIPWPGLVINATKTYASDLGHQLAEESKTFGACWYMIDRHTVEVSLRSVDEFDVSAIARHYGGGGHKNAAGFRMAANVFLKLLASPPLRPAA